MRRSRHATPRQAPHLQPTLTPAECGDLLSAVDTGICLLALESMRNRGVPCVSDADILRLRGVDVTDPAVVYKESQRHQLLAMTYLVDGMVLHHGHPDDPQ